MSERFIKYIPSQESIWLKENHPWAFLLLTTIAERARRIDGLPDGLKKGECHIGDHNAFGATRQQYRTALEVLTRRLHVKIIQTCRTRQKSTTGSTTIGTLVCLISSNVYDINLEGDNHQFNHRPTTDQPPTNHEKERIRKNKKEKDHHPYPSSKILPLGDDEPDGLADDFFLKENEKQQFFTVQTTNHNLAHNINYQSETPNIEVFKDIFITKEDLDACIAIKGSLEAVQHSIEYILRSPGRKCKIYNWPNALATWEIKNTIKPRVKENEEMAQRLSKTFDSFEKGNGRTARVYHDRQKDQKGILFEPQSPYLQSLFIPFTDSEFKEKVSKYLRDNKMQQGRISNS